MRSAGKWRTTSAISTRSDTSRRIPKAREDSAQIRVEAKAKGHGKMVVRTKSGYYAGDAAGVRDEVVDDCTTALPQTPMLTEVTFGLYLRLPFH